MAVLTGEFLCPECQAKLRIHERGKNSMEILCPECNVPIRIRLGTDGKLTTNKQDASEPEVAEKDSPLWKRQKISSSGQVPIYAAGIVLVALTLLGAWWFSSSKNNSPEAIAPEVANQSEEINNTQKQSETLPTVENGSEKSPDNIASDLIEENPDEGSPFAKNLLLLAQQVDIYQQQNGQFPSAFWKVGGGASSNQERFSWLAGLDPALNQDRSLLPQWNLSWKDPLNDRFVRRRRPELLNPAIRLQASSDRYPASHIVGIAGVGHDAATLPAKDPRAGIFGRNRTTKVEDVTDGLSNTMLASGVTGKLASWADGTASIRPFVLEPYINGPDGFGSGQKEGMHVLMADGSVRFLSKKTEPTIIRRMAAMADALPLDAKVPGEPGSKEILIASDPDPKPSSVDDKEKKMPPPKENPLPKKVPKSEPVPPQIDFEKALSRKVLEFELTEPASLETVLVELEAMIGIRIEFDPEQIPVADPIRKQKVSFSKRNVSFKELLSELIKPAALQYEIRKDHIAIVKKK